MAEIQLHKGDRVKFRLGVRFVQGEVKEDCGPIGIKGRHLYLVEFPSEAHSDALSQIELPTDELQSVPETVSAK